MSSVASRCSAKGTDVPLSATCVPLNVPLHARRDENRGLMGQRGEEWYADVQRRELVLAAGDAVGECDRPSSISMLLSEKRGGSDAGASALSIRSWML